MKFAQSPDGVAANRTHIAIVLDRSGSMESIRDDVVGGFNAFLSSQQAVAGEATLTLVRFDGQDPFEIVFDHAELQSIRPLLRDDFEPRGSTPLLDAVGRTILATELWVARQPSVARPDRVVVVVITDGQENASREFQLDRVRNLIKAKEGLGWQFLFLSADLAAFAEAGDIGFAHSKRAHFSKDAQGNREAFARTSMKIAEFRTGVVGDIGFDENDRKALGRGDGSTQ